MTTVHKPEVVGGEAGAEDGMVYLDGPDGIACAMTPGAAEDTARALTKAAEDARRQRPGPR